jgi:hypothetical protein
VKVCDSCGSLQQFPAVAAVSGSCSSLQQFLAVVAVCSSSWQFATVCSSLQQFATVCSSLQQFQTVLQQFQTVLQQFMAVCGSLQQLVAVHAVCGSCSLVAIIIYKDKRVIYSTNITTIAIMYNICCSLICILNPIFLILVRYVILLTLLFILLSIFLSKRTQYIEQ